MHFTKKPMYNTPMKKVILFAIILSVSSLFMVGCSGGADSTNDGVSNAPRIKTDPNKKAAVDNPAGSNAPAAL